MAAIRTVRKFDLAPTFAGTDYTTQAWQNYIAPVQSAANQATDQTLSTDMLNYYNDLQWNGADAYEGQALTDLQNYVRAVYHINIFPGG